MAKAAIRRKAILDGKMEVLDEKMVAYFRQKKWRIVSSTLGPPIGVLDVPVPNGGFSQKVEIVSNHMMAMESERITFRPRHIIEYRYRRNGQLIALMVL